jgi:hypothetical protein
MAAISTRKLAVPLKQHLAEKLNTIGSEQSLLQLKLLRVVMHITEQY